MKLNLEEKLTPEEIVELRKRAFSFADQMILEGISIGRELNREEIHSKTEQFVRDKLSAMTEYFVRDDIWETMPPMGYNPDPNVDIPEPSTEMQEGFKGAVDMAKNPDDILNNPDESQFNSDEFEKEEPPEWVKEGRKPTKEELDNF